MSHETSPPSRCIVPFCCCSPRWQRQRNDKGPVESPAMVKRTRRARSKAASDHAGPLIGDERTAPEHKVEAYFLFGDVTRYVLIGRSRARRGILSCWPTVEIIGRRTVNGVYCQQADSVCRRPRGQTCVPGELCRGRGV